MAIKTANGSTVKAAVNVRARIGREFGEILPLIQINSKESIENSVKKLKFLYRLIERFREDEKDNLFSSDNLALEYLQSQILDFIKVFDEKTIRERLAIAKSLQETAEKILETD